MTDQINTEEPNAILHNLFLAAIFVVIFAPFWLSGYYAAKQSLPLSLIFLLAGAGVNYLTSVLMAKRRELESGTRNG